MVKLWFNGLDLWILIIFNYGLCIDSNIISYSEGVLMVLWCFKLLVVSLQSFSKRNPYHMFMCYQWLLLKDALLCLREPDNFRMILKHRKRKITIIWRKERHLENVTSAICELKPKPLDKLIINDSLQFLMGLFPKTVNSIVIAVYI